MPARKKEPRTQPEYYTVAEVCIILNLGRTKVFDLIRKEQLPMEKFGSASRVPIVQFQEWLAQRAQAI
jgi:excisionase family DNA binding protein